MAHIYDASAWSARTCLAYIYIQCVWAHRTTSTHIRRLESLGKHAHTYTSIHTHTHNIPTVGDSRRPGWERRVVGLLTVAAGRWLCMMGEESCACENCVTHTRTPAHTLFAHVAGVESWKGWWWRGRNYARRYIVLAVCFRASGAQPWHIYKRIKYVRTQTHGPCCMCVCVCGVQWVAVILGHVETETRGSWLSDGQREYICTVS